jgi:hypothetical protein
VDLRIAFTGLTAILAFLFFLAVLDQWRTRRHAFQLVWALGMLWFSIGAGCEAIGAIAGWNEALYKTWYVTGAVCTAAWLGLGTAFLLGKTRFGYAFAFSLFLAGLFTFLTQQRQQYPDAGAAPVLYFVAAAVLAVAILVETYFQSDRWPRLAAVAVVGASLLALVLAVTATLPPPGYAVDAATGVPTAAIMPGYLRLLTPFMNVTGAFSLGFGALFSIYVFMPKKRVLAYSLDPTQKGDVFLFNLVISPVAFVVNFVASLPAAVRAMGSGRVNSRVPATILIAIGAWIPAVTDSLNRFGSTQLYGIGKLLAVAFLFAGFLVSIDVFSEFRIPFTRHVLRRRRPETPLGEASAPVPDADPTGATAG